MSIISDLVFYIGNHCGLRIVYYSATREKWFQAILIKNNNVWKFIKTPQNHFELPFYNSFSALCKSWVNYNSLGNNMANSVIFCSRILSSERNELFCGGITNNTKCSQHNHEWVTLAEARSASCCPPLQRKCAQSDISSKPLKVTAQKPKTPDISSEPLKVTVHKDKATSSHKRKRARTKPITERQVRTKHSLLAQAQARHLLAQADCTSRWMIYATHFAKNHKNLTMEEQFAHITSTVIDKVGEKKAWNTVLPAIINKL